MATVTLNPSPNSFPVSELIECGIWPALSPPARVVFAVIWDFHRRFPNTCRPSRATLARLAGVSPATVSRVLPVLEQSGLLTVIPSSGPGVNTYRVQWTDLSIPEHQSAGGGSPYKPATAKTDTYLSDDPKKSRLLRQRRKWRYRMPDGCVLRSAREQQVHAFLVDWSWPHWSNVNYNRLGIPDLHANSTVDFVIGPKLLLELWGVPRTLGEFGKYKKSKAKKIAAAESAGWTLLGIEPEDVVDEAFVSEVVDHWAKATREDANDTANALDRAGHWASKGPSETAMIDLARSASRRRDGRAPVEKPQGLYITVKNPTGGPPARQRVRPRLVLDAKAGTVPIDGLLDDLD